MDRDFKKAYFVSAIWLLPVLLVLLEAGLFLGRTNWQSRYLPYFITFWVLRAALTPAIVYFTVRFGSAYKNKFRLLLVHIGGFFLFSLFFWTAAYLVLHKILHLSELFDARRAATNLGIFGIIADNSISTNGVVYASTVVFCYVTAFFKQNISINKRAADLERSLLVSKLELLKSQLNSHFLFNTLHTISSLVVRRQNEEANKVLIQLSELLRFALKDNKEQLIPLGKELELLHVYLDIQKIRFKERLQFAVHLDPLVHNSLVPPLLLQPIVENAVKYGIEPFSANGHIQISVRTLDGQLTLSVTDSGKHPFSEINFSSGIGLENTRERLRQLFTGRHSFSVGPGNNGHGVTVTIQIPDIKDKYASIESIACR
jgi:hypothetical protein